MVDLRAATSALPGGLGAVASALGSGEGDAAEAADGVSAALDTRGGALGALSGVAEGGAALARADAREVLNLLRSNHDAAQRLRRIVGSIFRHAPLREYLDSTAAASGTDEFGDEFGEVSLKCYIYRYMLCESSSQFDSRPRTCYLTTYSQVGRGRVRR